MAYPDYAETMDEWWQIVNENWQSLRSLVACFYPRAENPLPDYEMPITAHAPEQARRACVNQIVKTRKMEPVNIKDHIETLKVTRSAGDLHRVFDETWFGIPESLGAHDLPGFGKLCDLCSDFPSEEQEAK